MITQLQAALRLSGVKFIRILWCDNANLIRVKATHIDIDYLTGLERGVGLSVAQQALPVMFDAVAQDSGLEPVGEAQLIPDWETLKILPYVPGHAQVIGDMKVDGVPWEHCPRAFLRAQIERLAEYDLQLKGAYENEFFLFKWLDGKLEPIDKTVYAQTQALNEAALFFNDLSDALQKQGMEPEYLYPESGPGQFELSIRYQNALTAADQQVLFRETVRGVAWQHGLIASFIPKPFEQAAGSGCHLNLSLWRDGRNVTGDENEPSHLSLTAQAFIAGILHHLHGLSGLTLASSNSYHRIKPHFWAGAFGSWGYSNREAAIRVSRGRGGAKRFEVKTVDATSNPYLALGAIIAAGVDGIENQLVLPGEVTTDPGVLSAEERTRRGSVQSLAASIKR